MFTVAALRLKVRSKNVNAKIKFSQAALGVYLKEKIADWDLQSLKPLEKYFNK